MKEFYEPQSSNQENKPLVPIKHRMPKFWKKQQALSNRKDLQMKNYGIEAEYMNVLRKVKELYKAQGSITVFERDYRYDNTENALAMHSFITPNFYWYLECFGFDYKIEYDFLNCPFEQEIRAMLRVYPLNDSAFQVKKSPDLVSYYGNVLKVQDAKYVYTLR